jgi:hypothetical protein
MILYLEESKLWFPYLRQIENGEDNELQGIVHRHLKRKVVDEESFHLVNEGILSSFDKE